MIVAGAPSVRQEHEDQASIRVNPERAGLALAARDSSLFWNAAGPCTVKVPGEDGEAVLSMDDWREYTDGQFDQHSLVTDPMFVDPNNVDYRLHPDSPAHRLGIEPIDTSKCGLLPDFAERHGEEAE